MFVNVIHVTLRALIYKYTCYKECVNVLFFSRFYLSYIIVNRKDTSLNV